MTKQQREIVILVVFVAILIAVAYSTFSGGNSTTPRQTRQAATREASAGSQRPAQKNSAKAEALDTSWVDMDGRVPTILAEVRGGRDPFHDLMMPTVVNPPAPKPTAIDRQPLPTYRPMDRVTSPEAPLPGSEDDLDAPPQLVVKGIVISTATTFAAVETEGQAYALLKQGDYLPNSAWQVTKIAPAEITLTKGKQSVPYRLSGGS